MVRILAGVAGLFVLVAASCPAQAYKGEGYIGEGIQGRPHGGRKAAIRDYYYRHGLGYHLHPRRHYSR